MGNPWPLEKRSDSSPLYFLSTFRKNSLVKYKASKNVCKSFYLIFNEHVSKNHEQVYVRQQKDASVPAKRAAKTTAFETEQSTKLKLKLKEESTSYRVKTSR